MAKRSKKPLTKPQQALADSWEKIKAAQENVQKFAGKYGGVPMPKAVSKRLSMDQVFTPPPRQTSNGYTIKSLPMGQGGTVPYDATLEEAKAGLAWRTGPLYNKGGPAYISDEDMKDVKSGATRRRP